jgi:hypothetical protein
MSTQKTRIFLQTVQLIEKNKMRMQSHMKFGHFAIHYVVVVNLSEMTKPFFNNFILFFVQMVLIFKQVDCQEIKRLSFIATKVIVGIFILIYFGTSLVIGNDDISFCLKRLKKLREDEKDWSEKCLNGQNHDLPCCKAEKEYNRERMCIHAKTCFYEGKPLFTSPMKPGCFHHSDALKI